MRVKISIDLITDGDFSLRDIPEFDSAIYFDQYEDGEDYSLTRIYDIDYSEYLHDAINFLEKTLCEIHVSYTHHWLIEDIYKLFEGAIEAVRNKESCYRTIGGNYDGTSIEVTFTK